MKTWKKCKGFFYFSSSLFLLIKRLVVYTKKRNSNELIKYRKYFSSIRLRVEVTISDSSKCRRREIECIEISPSFHEVIKYTSDNKYKKNYDDFYFEFLSESESCMYLSD